MVRVKKRWGKIYWRTWLCHHELSRKLCGYRLKISSGLDTQPSHSLFTLLPSGKRYRSTCCRPTGAADHCHSPGRKTHPQNTIVLRDSDIIYIFLNLVWKKRQVHLSCALQLVNTNVETSSWTVVTGLKAFSPGWHITTIQSAHIRLIWADLNMMSMKHHSGDWAGWGQPSGLLSSLQTLLLKGGVIIHLFVPR